ncbi:unnamed protein product, partial [Nezara viridula]
MCGDCRGVCTREHKPQVSENVFEESLGKTLKKVRPNAEIDLPCKGFQCESWTGIGAGWLDALVQGLWRTM